jgi:adenylosuccinate synthase
VTRTYLTRHGDGPLRTECHKEELDARVRETTNVTNPFQGHFRFGRLDTEAMEARIRADFAGAGSRNNWKASIAVTHTDQCDPGEELLEMTERFDERYLIGGVGRTQIRS